MLLFSIIYPQFPCENHFSSADARLREVFCQLESKTELFPKNSPKFYPHNFFLTDIHPSGNLKYIDGWLQEISFYVAGSGGTRPYPFVVGPRP
jgi:hypothetical protein